MEVKGETYMTTKEVEQLLGLSKQTLIYYEKAGFVKPARDSNNYRNYSDKDIEILKYIISLRAIDLSIEDIKLIFEGRLSLRKAIDAKKDYIENEKKEINKIENRIKQMITRRKVKISFHNLMLNQWLKENTLFFNDDHIKCDDIIIDFLRIQLIEISMCSYMNGMSFNPHAYNTEYHVDLDIHCTNDTYSFEVVCNTGILEMFQYFDEHSLNVHDPLGLKQIYKDKRDAFELVRYFDYNFKKMAKTYNLDNPREIKMTKDIKQRYSESYDRIEQSKTILKNIFHKK